MAMHEQEVSIAVLAAQAGERAVWQKPQWRCIEAAEAEASLPTPSADGTFNAS